MGDDLNSSAPHRPAALAALVLAFAFLVPAWGVILFGGDQGRGAHDQNQYHLKAIERFSAQWPRLDFSDYESATTPGYHVAVAAVHRFVTDDVVHLRLLFSLMTAGLLATLGWAVARRMGVLPALALGAPLVASLYVFSAGAWLLPDNAAWWGVLGILLVALAASEGRGRRVDAGLLIAGGVILCVLVLVRQVHLWAAALLWLGAWIGASPQATLVKPLDINRRARRAVLAVAATIPAFVIVAWFVHIWGGPVPRMFQPGGAEHEHDLRANIATPALMLALVGIFATFYGGFLWPAIRAGALKQPRAGLVLALGACVGLAAAIVPETTYSVEAGRWSGLWNIVRVFDERGIVVAGRSPVVLVLAAAGALWISAWWLALGVRERWVFLGAWVAFTAAQTATSLAWQRYHEPFILMMLAVFAAGLAGVPDMRGQRWALAGPVVLAVLLALVTLVSLA